MDKLVDHLQKSNLLALLSRLLHFCLNTFCIAREFEFKTSYIDII